MIVLLLRNKVKILSHVHMQKRWCHSTIHDRVAYRIHAKRRYIPPSDLLHMWIGNALRKVTEIYLEIDRQRHLYSRREGRRESRWTEIWRYISIGLEKGPCMLYTFLSYIPYVLAHFIIFLCSVDARTHRPGQFQPGKLFGFTKDMDHANTSPKNCKDFNLP